MSQCVDAFLIGPVNLESCLRGLRSSISNLGGLILGWAGPKEIKLL